MHKKVNYAEFETLSDYSSETNRKRNHGSYISWSSNEDAILTEQVQKFLESQKVNSSNISNNINDNTKNENDTRDNDGSVNNNDKKNISTINPLNSINWNKIAEKIENKNARQCQTRWQNILDPNRVKGPWTEKEDLKLIELVKKFGPEKWSNISTYLPGRLGKQCRERWYNHLNPEVNKTGWSKEEEWVLFLLHRKYGNSWSIFSEHIPGRTDNTIKNHWNSIMKKNIVGINNQYQDLIKGKSKEEIEEIENDIMTKCNKVINKDYNDYYQEKIKDFPLVKFKFKHNLGKDTIIENNINSSNNNIFINNSNSNDNINDDENNEKDLDFINKEKNKSRSTDVFHIKKTNTKENLHKIFTNIKIKKNEITRSGKSKNRSAENSYRSSNKKDKFMNINEEELKLMKSGEKILQKDKNLLIKEAEDKYKQKQKQIKKQKQKQRQKEKKRLSSKKKRREEREIMPVFNSGVGVMNNNEIIIYKSCLSDKKILKQTEKNCQKEKVNKKSHKKIKKKNKFNISKLSNNATAKKERQNKEFTSSLPFHNFPMEKLPFYFDKEKEFNKSNIFEQQEKNRLNNFIFSNYKETNPNKAKKDSQSPFGLPAVRQLFTSDIKKSSESSGGVDSIGKIKPEMGISPSFVPYNDKLFFFTNPHNVQHKNMLYNNSNPKLIKFIGGNGGNKISTDSNSLMSCSMNQSIISANSAFKKSGSGSGSGSGKSFQPGGNVFNLNNTMTDLNKEFFASIPIDDKNQNNKL